MKQGYENKDAGAPRIAVPKKIRCVRECEAPGLGSWQPGDVIEEPRTVAILHGNPNFVDASKEEK